MELRGELAEHQEIIIVGAGGRTLLVDLGAQKVGSLSLKPGSWHLSALSRNGEGMVISHTKSEAAVKGRGKRVVALELVPTSQETTAVRPENLSHTWHPEGGMHFSWEYVGEAEGSWELWIRKLDQPLWERVEEVPASARSISYASTNVQDYLYGIRFVPDGGQGAVWASQLERLPVGFVELSWDFRHEFPNVPFLQLSSALLFDPIVDDSYTDFVAHFRTAESFARRHELVAELGLEIKRELPSLLAALVEPGSTSTRSLEEWSFYEDHNLFLEPNRIVVVTSVVNPSAWAPWYLEYARISQAQSITSGDQAVRIAVLDTGLNPQELGKGVNILPGYNFISNNPDTSDDDKRSPLHGTRITHSITEVIPTVSIQPVKVLDGRGYGRDFHVAEGLLYAVGLHDFIPNPTPAQILNLSLGQSGVTELQRQVEMVTSQAGALIIGASGNTPSGVYSPGVFYPAAYSEVVAVGAIAPHPITPQRAYYSHYGPELDLVAPPTRWEGTSFSTALVSGVAGLMLANGVPTWEIRESLRRTAIDLGQPGFDWEHGYGLVNAHWAVLGISDVVVELRTRGGQDIVKEEIPLEQNSRRLSLAPGEYELQIWVNLSDGEWPTTGDYLATANLTVVDGKEHKEKLTLTELKQ